MRIISFSNLLRSLVNFYISLSKLLLPRRSWLWLFLIVSFSSLFFLIFYSSSIDGFYGLISISLSLWSFWILAIIYIYNKVEILSLNKGGFINKVKSFINNLYIYITSLFMTFLSILAIVITIRSLNFLV
ncbi:MAG: hypothetical protein CMQ51_03735 [Gammaproteobacteria bacterium]|nr:hypothetical protein [Gammaproteobacteria bacterium]